MAEAQDPFEEFVASVDAEHAAVDRSSWPAGVEEISLGDMSRFGVDAQKRLYYDGKPVEIRRRLDLSGWEKTFALLVGLFTILGGIGAIAQGWAAAHQWSCQIEVVDWHCPAKK